MPFNTTHFQPISIDKLTDQFGITNINAYAQYQLLDGKYSVLVLEQIEGDFAGGKANVDKLTLLPGDQPIPLNIKLEKLQVADLIKLTDIKGLTGTGQINGILPIEIGKDGITINNGKLHSLDRGGVIRYQPEEFPPGFKNNQSARLALQALSNLHYENLKVDIQYTPQISKLSIHFLGFNPGFFNGKQVQFNFNLTGPLGAMLDVGLIGDKLEEMFAHQIEANSTADESD